MYPASQLIYLLFAKASSEIVSIAVKKSFIRKGNSEKMAEMCQNYTRTGLKTSDEKSYKVMKSNLKFWVQIVVSM